MRVILMESRDEADDEVNGNDDFGDFEEDEVVGSVATVEFNQVNDTGEEQLGNWMEWEILARHEEGDMENSHAVAFSSSPAAEQSVVGYGEGGPSLPTDVSHGDRSSEEGWFDDDCDNDELHNEWKLRRDKFYNDGYREGITEGQKDAAQDGFNIGFKDSVMVGYKWGIVKGVTSALANIPDEVKEKLIGKDEIRKEFMNLHRQVGTISTEDALKLFYNNIKKENSSEQTSSVSSDPSLAHENVNGGLETYVEKLESLLKESCAINVRFESKENAGSKGE